RRSAERDYEAGQGTRKPRTSSSRRSRASKQALKREGRGAASRGALSAHAKRVAAARRHGRGSSHAAAH
ncbi:MAG: DNA-binding protein, partial [Steroidobacteraceae bacterium]